MNSDDLKELEKAADSAGLSSEFAELMAEMKRLKEIEWMYEELCK